MQFLGAIFKLNGASTDTSCQGVGEQTLTPSSSDSRCNYPVSSIAHGVGIKDLHVPEVQRFRNLPAWELVSLAICFSGYS